MKEISIQNLEELKVGDIIRHVSGGDALIVVGHYGTRITAIREQDVTNPIEWVKLVPNQKEKPTTLEEKMKHKTCPNGHPNISKYDNEGNSVCENCGVVFPTYLT